MFISVLKSTLIYFQEKYEAITIPSWYLMCVPHLSLSDIASNCMSNYSRKKIPQYCTSTTMQLAHIHSPNEMFVLPTLHIVIPTLGSLTFI